MRCGPNAAMDQLRIAHGRSIHLTAPLRIRCSSAPAVPLHSHTQLPSLTLHELTHTPLTRASFPRAVRTPLPAVMSRLVAVPANSAAAQSRGQSQPAYVYQSQSPSVVENVLMTLLNPGVNSQTILVLNSTLGILSVVIGLMLWRFDVSGQVRLQLWIFLAVAVSLLMSVNW